MYLTSHTLRQIMLGRYSRMKNNSIYILMLFVFLLVSCNHTPKNSMGTRVYHASDRLVKHRKRFTTQYFSDRGIPFPPGSGLKWNPEKSQLSVTNTAENLKEMGLLIRALNVPQPYMMIISGLHKEIPHVELNSIKK